MKTPKDAFLFLEREFSKMVGERRNAYWKRVRKMRLAQYDEESDWDLLPTPEDIQPFFELYLARQQEEDDYGFF